jgi:phosphatidylglycerophosphatase A
MTLTTHATLGAVIGHAVGNPVLAFVFGFISHFMIDMIPHGDTGLADNYKVHKKSKKAALAYVMVDAIFAIFFVLMLANTKDLTSMQNFTWGIIGGVLPDLLTGVYEITKSKTLKWFNTVHFFFHDYFVKRKGDVPLKYAILGQIVFIALLQSKL